ncbi:hypothetical protein DFH28DRAFT_1131386 [Melampsora americana]|nr:hypothetical protein DFH28DRAFT_1131386 [Melampsora americana]
MCQERQSVFHDLCAECLDNCLATTLSSHVDTTSGYTHTDPGSSLVNSNGPTSHPHLNHTTNTVPNYLHPNSGHPSSSTFNANAFKHTAATVAAHNKALQHPPTAPSHLSPNLLGQVSLVSSQTFDPLASAKENRTWNISGLPSMRSKQARGGSVGTASTQGAQKLLDNPAYNGSSPVITFTCGFETYMSPKWAKKKPLSICCTLNLFNPDAYKELRLDLWTHFKQVFVPNDIVDVLEPDAFRFTMLGNQDSTQLNQTSSPLSVPPVSKNLYLAPAKTVEGIERFGLSCEPYLLHSRRGTSWIGGLQWHVQPDGNTVESDFIAYHWHNEDKHQGRTHRVQTIDIWTADGPIAVISKSALCNPFHYRIVSQSKMVDGLFNHVEFWDTLCNLCLVEHTIISSDMPTKEFHHDPQNQHLGGPLETMHVEEKLDLPLQAFSTSRWFGFPLVQTPTNMHYLLDAFCHWLYQHSQGHCFVTDLHGSGTVITKPQIMDVNPANVWGKRNGHAAAVALMPVQHKCELGCKVLKLPPLKPIPVTLTWIEKVWQHAQDPSDPSNDVIEGGEVDLTTFLAFSAPKSTPQVPKPITLF